MPRKIVERRAPSLLTRHKDWRFGILGDPLPPSSCPGQLMLYITPSVVPFYEAMAVVRCMGCGQPLEARGVIPEGRVYWTDDAWDDDPDDCTDSAWGV